MQKMCCFGKIDKIDNAYISNLTLDGRVFPFSTLTFGNFKERILARNPKTDEKKPGGNQKKSRAIRSFPSEVFNEAYNFAKDVYRIGAGQKVRRLTLFHELQRSPTSSASQMILTNAAKYGLTKGSYKADFIELTPLGEKAVSDTGGEREKEAAKIESGILSIPPFKSLFESFKESKLPAKSVLLDKAIESGVSADAAQEAVDTFIVNLRDLNLLKVIAGAEHVISAEMRLDEVGSKLENTIKSASSDLGQISSGSIITSDRASFETTAFYVSPIGEEGSIHRKHADMFANSIVEPAIEFTKLKLIRADKIETPGLITRQVMDYLVHSRLVIVDLSFHNPNVFYELAVRHFLRKPTVQIMRKLDRIPFDISQSRTIVIDEEDKYDLVAKMPTFISAISAQVRQALDDPDSVDNPLSVFYPNLAAKLS